MPKRYYFQAPSFTVNPESDIAPKLGSIFASLDRLTGPLNQLDHNYIPSNLINSSANTDFQESASKNVKGSVGMNATVAQGLAGSAEAIYTFARDKKNVYQCELLETLEFEPNKEFIADAITASQAVQMFLENRLKIATGFSTSTSKETYHGPVLKVGVDATAVGIPAEAGPEIELETGNARMVSQGRSVNKTIFAYRVIRIRVKRDGEAKFKYKSGGKYTIDDDDEDSDEEEPWNVEELGEEDRLEEFPESEEIEIKDGSG